MDLAAFFGFFGYEYLILQSMDLVFSGFRLLREILLRFDAGSVSV